jgi:ubiquinone/menaquinone biosynthesis C-methylase UbiE
MKQLIQQQAGNPSGLIGRLFGWTMNLFNRAANRWAIELLNLQPTDRLLEVGFGTGQALEYATTKITQGFIVGLDHSETMLAIATQRNATAIAAKRVQLHLGEVEALPFPDASFDKAYAINCIYFWEPPQRGFAELRRVLKPGGALAIVARHKQLDTHRQYTPDVICTLMKEAGFSQVTSQEGPASRSPVFGVTGLA